MDMYECLPQFRRIKALMEMEPDKTPATYFASLLEEVGELATAVKVEQKVITHKQLAESAAAETVDVAICGLMMYVVGGGEIDNLCFTRTTPELTTRLKARFAKLNPMNALPLIGNYVGKIGTFIADPVGKHQPDHDMQNVGLVLVSLCAELHGHYVSNQPDTPSFAETMTAKLDKWEKNLKERLKQ